MIRLALASIVVWVASSSLSAQLVPQPRFGDPLPGLTAEELDRFAAGQALFEQPLDVAGGLGPNFNQTSCVGCHSLGASGGAGTISVTRFGQAAAMGDPFDPLEALGGSLLQAQAISDDCLEVIPPEADVVIARITPALFGSGLVEAIVDGDLLALESNGGSAHLVPALEDPTGPLRVGRFGWKSQLATVLSFSGDASLNEMGLTNRLLTEETAPNGDLDLLEDCDTVADPEDAPDLEGLEFIDRVTDFQRFLAAPPQTPRSGMQGEAIFESIGCADCHHPEFTTGPAAEAALSGVSFRPYSDFLLHDMGSLGDGIVQGDATETLMRTPPLWGISVRGPLLHDGRVAGGTFAQRIEAAVAFHDGEAAASSAAFAALPAGSRDLVQSFLRSLGRREFDHDDDEDVDEADFLGFLACFQGAGGIVADDPCAVSDIDQDGDVDAADFASFLLVYDGDLDDCNGNGQPDIIDLVEGTADDCNSNGRPDECDVNDGTSDDVNGNGIPDECESLELNVIFCAELGTGAVDSCAALESALSALGEEVVVVSSLMDPVIADLAPSNALWALLGTFPANHPLTAAEGQILADLSSSGVPVYIESCDAWGFDPPTLFADVDGVEDTTVVDGDDSFDGMSGAAFGALDLSDLSGLVYDQDQPGTIDYTDQILPTGTTGGQPVDLGGPNAGTVWFNDPDPGEAAYPVATLYEPAEPYGVVIAQSWELGGFGGDLPVLVQLYLEALRPDEEPGFQRGDCNGDGALGLGDPIFLLAFLFTQGDPAPCAASCDGNDDGALSLPDAVSILNVLFAGGGMLPPPFFECAPDPTPDALTCVQPGC